MAGLSELAVTGLVAGMVAGVAGYGCSFVLGADDEQCQTDADCAARGFGSASCVDAICQDAKWGCLATLGAAPMRDSSRKITYRVPLVDFVKDAPVQGLEAQVCLSTYPCADSNKHTEKVTSDEDGMLVFQIDYALAGAFISLEDPNAGAGGGIPEGYPPSLIMVHPAPTEDTTLVAIPLLDSQLFYAGLLQLDGEGGADAAERGHVLAQVFDCSGAPSAGVKFSLGEANTDGSTVPFYIDGSSAQPGLDETTPFGAGGFLDVSGFSVSVIARRASDGVKVGQAPVILAPGVATFVTVTPSL